jgi:hypothetical protein
MPRLTVDGLKKATWGEHAVRCVFGGAVTVATGAVTHWYGPSVGGLFLAFPAILPASVTLLKRHDGRAEAAQATDGARLGAVALIAFALAAAYLAPRVSGVLTLAGAGAAWLSTALLSWWLVYGRRRRRAPRRRTP